MTRIVGSDLTSGASLQVVRLFSYGCGKVVSRDEVCHVRGSALGYAFLFLDRARCLDSASGARVLFRIPNMQNPLVDQRKYTENG